MVNIQNTKDYGYSDGATLTQCERPNGYKLSSELKSTSIDCDDTDASKNLDDNDKDGYSTCAGDCNDSDASICPNDQKCPEKCGDDKDNNCNGKKDEGCCEVSIKVSPSEVYPQKTGGNTEADIIVSWNKPAPPEGCTVKFKVEPVEKSGGHNHDGNRPKGSVSPDTLTISGGPVGIVSGKHKYYSSEVSGEEKIIAEIDGEKKDEAMVRVRVPGFFELGTGDEYELIGQRSSHPKNHFGTENTLYSILDIADAYYEQYNGTLRINDISLEWGGLFDWRAKWQPDHKTHRVGKNVDVDDVTAEGKKVTKSLLYKIIITKGFNISVLDEGNHLHLTFP